MNTENVEIALDEEPQENPLADLIWSYAHNWRDEQFYSLLERLLNTEQFTTAIELLKLHEMHDVRCDLDAIAEGIGHHVAKLAIALDHMDDYGIKKFDA